MISVAASIVSVHPRTLRIYEEEGLLAPQRRNNLRLYSEADLVALTTMRELVDAGWSPAGAADACVRLVRGLGLANTISDDTARRRRILDEWARTLDARIRATPEESR